MNEETNLPEGLQLAAYKPGDQAPEGYLAWHEWAEVQHKAGLRQVECSECGLWRYPQQLSDLVNRWSGKTSRGRVVKKAGAVCLSCASKRSER